MSFGQKLSQEFYNQSYKLPFKEVPLFNALKVAFDELSKTSGFQGAIDLIHGSKGQVRFIQQSPYITTLAPGTPVQKELFDMLFLVYSNNKKKIRLMYLQNKRGRTECDFYGDLLQLDLLANQREIISVPLPYCTFGDPHILKSQFMTVGSFGVFYKTTVNGASAYEMAFYPAIKVLPITTRGRNKSRTVWYDSQYFGKEETYSNGSETLGTRNLEEFGDALVSMKIGKPIESKDPAYHSIAAFLSAHSSGFSRIADVPYNEQVTSHAAAFLGVSTVVMINADELASRDL